MTTTNSIDTNANENIRLPKGWPKATRVGVLQVLSLARFAMAHTRSFAANSPIERLRLKGENERLTQELTSLREELRIKDARMARIPPAKRPHYSPEERMAILALRAARNWSRTQTAATFLITAETISSWTSRVADEGTEAFIKLREPVNKFPEFVREIVRQLKTLCPFLGKVKIAEKLSRAGLHLGATTIGRMLKEKNEPTGDTSAPTEIADGSGTKKTSRKIVSKYANHIWLIDLTCLPIFSGFWVAWLPFSLPQYFPFCWWLVVVMDHHSRRVLTTQGFAKTPDTSDIQATLVKTFQSYGRPRYLISDQGPQFCNEEHKQWLERRNIRPRFGAIGKHGSIALVERAIQTVKHEWLRFLLIPLRQADFQSHLDSAREWHNVHRPHMALGGKTPTEVYLGHSPANEQPRLEPRPRWPRGSSCAVPTAPVKGKCGVTFRLNVRYHDGLANLPIVTLKAA